jgi:hypothetical protein
MRTAALASAAVIAIGAYLMIAASFALSPSLIALGMLGIAVTTAVAIAMDPQPASR